MGAGASILEEARRTLRAPGTQKLALARRLQRVIQGAVAAQAEKLSIRLAGAIRELLAGASDEERAALSFLLSALEAVPGSRDPLDAVLRLARNAGTLPDEAEVFIRGLRRALARASAAEGSESARQALEVALSLAERILRQEGGNGAHMLAAWLGRALLQGGRPRARRLALRLSWAGQLQVKLEVGRG